MFASRILFAGGTLSRAMTRILLCAISIFGGCTTSAPSAPVPTAASAPTKAAPARIDGPTAKALVAGGALLLDVRTPEEFAAGRIDGARNLPVDSLAGALSTLPKDKPIVVYCAAGVRAGRAAQLLADNGFDARNLGAMSAWPR
jgi:rhodanese-related sulfurtransferase